GVAGADARLDLAAGDDARADVDLADDERALADDEHVLAADVAAEAAVDAHPALEEELALEMRAAAQEGVDLGGALAARVLAAGASGGSRQEGRVPVAREGGRLHGSM